MSRNFAFKEDGDVLKLSGSLTIEHGDHLLETLRETVACRSRVLVSLAEVKDLDTAGLQILYAARNQAQLAGKELVWTEISAACAEIAKLAGMRLLLGFPEAM